MLSVLQCFYQKINTHMLSNHGYGVTLYIGAYFSRAFVGTKEIHEDFFDARICKRLVNIKQSGVCFGLQIYYSHLGI